MASNSSAGSDSMLGGITVVGCSAEGSAAIPQTACSSVGTPEEPSTRADSGKQA